MPRTPLRGVRGVVTLALAASGLVLIPAAGLAEPDDDGVRCAGSAAVCTAHVHLDGSASNARVVVQLPAAALRLRASTPAPVALQGAFRASRGTYAAGGSQYRFTMSAMSSPGPGYVAMTFTNPARPQAKAASTVRCLGDDRVCTAHVSLRGGAANKRVRVVLPGTGLRLALGARAAVPGASRRAYSIGRGGYSADGSAYAFTLNAIGSLGKGAWLTLTFRDPS